VRSLFFGAFVGERALLNGAEGHHAAVVSRVRVGEEIEVSDNNGRHAIVRVTAVAAGDVHGEVIGEVPASSVVPSITVAQALLKGDAMTDAVDLLTQVGVGRVIPWSAERSIVQWSGEREAKAVEKFRAAAFSAAKQSRRPTIPVIEEVRTTEHLIGRFPEFDQVIVLHEQAADRIAQRTWSEVQSVLVIVGPEGGIHSRELEAFESAGATSVVLGPTVLRGANAGAIASAVIQAATSWRA
jgi:16S rRNA (uracil1498-N3)-methyltransferase